MALTDNNISIDDIMVVLSTSSGSMDYLFDSARSHNKWGINRTRVTGLSNSADRLTELITTPYRINDFRLYEHNTSEIQGHMPGFWQGGLNNATIGDTIDVPFSGLPYTKIEITKGTAGTWDTFFSSFDLADTNHSYEITGWDSGSGPGSGLDTITITPQSSFIHSLYGIINMTNTSGVNISLTITHADQSDPDVVHNSISFVFS